MRIRSLHAVLTIAATFTAAASALLLGLWHLQGRSSVFDRLEASLLDWRFEIVGPRPSPNGIVIVAIDDDTVRRASAYPLPRTTIAQLVRGLIDADAKVIGLDVLFLDPGPGGVDDELASVLQKMRTVIAAAALFDRFDSFVDTPLGSGQSATLPLAERVLLPVPALGNAAAVGLVNITTDRGGTPRYIPLVVRSGGELIPSFVLRTATLAAGTDPELESNAIRLGVTRTDVDLGLHLPIRFLGPRGTVPTLSAQTVLDGQIREAVRGRIVIIGATAVGIADTFATPFDPVLPGVEVLATAIGHLVSGNGLTRNLVTRRIDASATLVLPIAAILLLSLRQIALGVALTIAVLMTWLACTVVAFDRGYWLAIALPLASALSAGLIYGVIRLWLEQRSENRLEVQQEALRRFHPPALADKLMVSPDFLEEPIQQHAAVLFVDLSGFTGLSERLGAQRTRSFLKEFHLLIEGVATANGGFVLSYMGDGAMVVFGLPSEQSDDASRAIKAAQSLAKTLLSWLAERTAGSERKLGLRVGLHYGSVVLSRLGPDTHQHITASGDTVNVASRLLETAKQYGATLAISIDAISAARDAGDDTTYLSATRRVSIRGREQPISVWVGEP
jgi:adenylate cyclase